MEGNRVKQRRNSEGGLETGMTTGSQMCETSVCASPFTCSTSSPTLQARDVAGRKDDGRELRHNGMSHLLCALDLREQTADGNGDGALVAGVYPSSHIDEMTQKMEVDVALDDGDRIGAEREQPSEQLGIGNTQTRGRGIHLSPCCWIIMYCYASPQLPLRTETIIL